MAGFDKHHRFETYAMPRHDAMQSGSGFAEVVNKIGCLLQSQVNDLSCKERLLPVILKAYTALQWVTASVSPH